MSLPLFFRRLLAVLLLGRFFLIIKQLLHLLLLQVPDVMNLSSFSIGKEPYITSALSFLKDTLAHLELYDSVRSDDDLMKRKAIGIPQGITTLLIGHTRCKQVDDLDHQQPHHRKVCHKADPAD